MENTVMNDCNEENASQSACMVRLVETADLCNSNVAGVEGPKSASALPAERQSPKESPHPHHTASMRNLAATTADLSASSRRCVHPSTLSLIMGDTSCKPQPKYSISVPM